MNRKVLDVMSNSIWGPGSELEAATSSPSLYDQVEGDVEPAGGLLDVQDKQAGLSWDSGWESSTKSWIDDWFKPSMARDSFNDFGMGQDPMGHDGYGLGTALSDFREEEAPNVSVTLRVFKVFMVPSDDVLAMWRCAGVALGLVLATLAVMALLWLMLRWCCCRKRHVATCVADGELERGLDYLPPVGWSDGRMVGQGGWPEKHGVQMIEPRLLELYTKPCAGEVDPRQIDSV